VETGGTGHDNVIAEKLDLSASQDRRARSAPRNAAEQNGRVFVVVLKKVSVQTLPLGLGQAELSWHGETSR
jgi:hypothetical protein